MVTHKQHVCKMVKNYSRPLSLFFIIETSQQANIIICLPAQTHKIKIISKKVIYICNKIVSADMLIQSCTCCVSADVKGQ